MTIGTEATDTASYKQKLNTKCSTKAGLVAVDDALGEILWTRHFLEAQGKHIPTTTNQNNKIAKYKNIKLKSSRHLHVQAFRNRQNKERRSRGSILPYQNHVSQLLHKANTGQYSQKNVKHHTKSARHQKMDAVHGVYWMKTQIMVTNQHKREPRQENSQMRQTERTIQ